MGSSNNATTTLSWQEADSPVTSQLNDIVHTTADPVAIGSGGLLLTREDGTWSVALDNGPAGKGHTLVAADTTDDGGRVWFAGSSGALAAYDVDSGRIHDFTAAGGLTSTWNAITVVGPKGSERVLVANTSGTVLTATNDDDGFNWEDGSTRTTSVGSGASIVAATTDENRFPYLVNSTGRAFAYRKNAWQYVGIEQANTTLKGIYVDEKLTLAVADDGCAYREKSDGTWVETNVSPGALHAIDRIKDLTLAVGSSGRAFRRAGNTWEATDPPTSKGLRAVSIDRNAIAVGTGGTILEGTFKTKGNPTSKKTKDDGQKVTGSGNDADRGSTVSKPDNVTKPANGSTSDNVSKPDSVTKVE